MARGTVPEMSPARRRALVETAAREFAVAGYEQASLNRIIRSCGLSKSSFYHYVRSKQELFDLVVTDLGEALVRALDVPAPRDLEGDFWVGVAALLDRLLLLARTEPRFTDLGRMFYLPGAPTAGGVLPRAQAVIDDWLHDALAAGRAAGAVRTDLPTSLQGTLTVAVLRALDEWSLWHVDELAPQETEQLAHAQLDILRRLLAPTGLDVAPGRRGRRHLGRAPGE